MFILSDADLRAYFESSNITINELAAMTGKSVDNIKKIVGDI